MSSNYRVMRHHAETEDWYGIHEVYYDAQDRMEYISTEPVIASGETAEELGNDLAMQLKAFNQEILDYDAGIRKFDEDKKKNDEIAARAKILDEQYKNRPIKTATRGPLFPKSPRTKGERQDRP